MKIQVFEYEVLKVGEKGFSYLHYQKIVKLNRQFSCVEIGENFIRFKQYVGVLQIGQLQIEILPKVDTLYHQNEVKTWQKVLFQLLTACKKLPLIPISEVELFWEKNSILEIYVAYFLSKIEKLLQRGLAKNYENISQNQSLLKGKINFSKQIEKNLFHEERFFVSYQHYTHHHFLNLVIGKTLFLLKQQTSNLLHQRKINHLLSYFPISDEEISEQKIDELVFTKKTYHYKELMPFCKLFLYQYAPQFVLGKQKIASFLVDMNQLWEEYIFEQLKNIALPQWKIEVKKRVNFWGNTNFVSPDIVLQIAENKRIIIDTKWKILQQLSPNHHDLQQMFVYNYLQNAERAILIYPKAHFEQGKKAYFYQYDEEKGNVVNECNQCEIAFIDVREGHLSVQNQLKKLFY